MALTKENHIIDTETGFAVDPATGHPIGLVAAPHARVTPDEEWPQWVQPHASQVMRREEPGAPVHISVPAFPTFHVNRTDGKVTVLVHNEDEAKLAAAEYKEPTGEMVAINHDPRKRELLETRVRTAQEQLAAYEASAGYPVDDGAAIKNGDVADEDRSVSLEAQINSDRNRLLRDEAGSKTIIDADVAKLDADKAEATKGPM